MKQNCIKKVDFLFYLNNKGGDRKNFEFDAKFKNKWVSPPKLELIEIENLTIGSNKKI